MKCSKCGFVSHDYLEECKKCRAPLNSKPIYKFLYKSDLSNNSNSITNFAKDFGSEELTGQVTELPTTEIYQYNNNIANEEQSENLYEEEKLPENKINKPNIFSAPTLIEPNLKNIDTDVDIANIKGISDDFDFEDFKNPEQFTDNLSFQDDSENFNNYNEDIKNETNDKDFRIGDYKYASITRRFFAFLLDIIVVFVVTTATFVIGIRLLGLSPDTQNTNLFGILIRLYLILFVLCSSYFVILTGIFGQTLGKLLLKIKVIKTDGNEIGIIRSVIRWFGYALSILSFLLGLIWIFIDAKNQALHDKLAETVVVRI